MAATPEIGVVSAPEHPSVKLIRELVEMLARVDLASVSDRITDDVVWHYIGAAEPVRSKGSVAPTSVNAP